jgi:hypothetical protein
MSKIVPIGPEEVVSRKIEEIPGHVLAIWNQMITDAWNGHSSTIMQKTAIKRLGGTGLDMAWLNIEDAYRKVGWEVVYDKPGYNESYEPSFTFRKKKV